LGTAILAVNY